MNQLTIITPDPIAEALLSLLAAQLPSPGHPVVLLDITQGNRAGEFPGARVILFTAAADPDCLTAARTSGADGFWYLTPSAESLEKVLSGAVSFPDAAPAVPFGEILSDAVTERELQVLRELVAGKTDPQIAEAISLAVPTVKHHIQQLRNKTGFANRTQLAVAAVTCGLILPQTVTRL